MNEFEVIQKYLMNYSGVHYRKPIDEYDDMIKIKSMGKNARDNFVKLGKSVISKLSDFNMLKCSSWVSMNQIIPNYLWIQFKKEGFEKCPSSISLAIKKAKEKIYFYIAVEIKDMDAEDEDFKNHNKILDIPLSNSELYYSGDNEEYFNIGRDDYNVKNMIERKLIKKVRVQKNIDNFCKVEQKEIINKIIEAIQVLEPYYNKIILNYNKSNEQNKKSQNTCLNEWIIPCNPSQYDVIGAFNELNKIEWKQSTNIQVGDIVYIYVGEPFKEIKYKCVAKKVNLDSASKIDDSKFILDGSNYENYGRYMELELIKEYVEKQYSLVKIKKHGLKSVRGPIKVKEELCNYIDLNETLEEDYKEDEILVKKLKEIEIPKFIGRYEYKGKKKERQEPKIQNGVKVYIRDKKVAINALARANYSCEIDENHPTFIRRNVDVKYTEPHHLIPMAYSDLFNVSLDVEENIVSLCSNCHNLLHYGRGFEFLLKKLYDERIEHLKKVGLYIKFEDLLEKYL